jgi:hypothetical protein
MEKNRKFNNLKAARKELLFAFPVIFCFKLLDITAERRYNYIGKDFEISVKIYKISLAIKGSSLI